MGHEAVQSCDTHITEDPGILSHDPGRGKGFVGDWKICRACRDDGQGTGGSPQGGLFERDGASQRVILRLGARA